MPYWRLNAGLPSAAVVAERRRVSTHRLRRDGAVGIHLQRHGQLWRMDPAHRTPAMVERRGLRAAHGLARDVAVPVRSECRADAARESSGCHEARVKVVPVGGRDAGDRCGQDLVGNVRRDEVKLRVLEMLV